MRDSSGEREKTELGKKGRRQERERGLDEKEK